jgi:hypothetical protein
MFKFLIYLFLFYVVFRFVFGRLMGNTIKTKVYHRDVHHHHHYSDGTKKEGTITVDPRTVQQPKDDKNLGEYVEYEEVK